MVREDCPSSIHCKNELGNANVPITMVDREFLLTHDAKTLFEVHICDRSSSHSSLLVHPNRPDRLTLPAESINQPPIHAPGPSEPRNIGPVRPATGLYQFVTSYMIIKNILIQ